TAQVRLGVIQIPQYRRAVLSFRGHGHHLVAQTKFQCEVLQRSNIVLRVGAKQSLPQSDGGNRIRDRALENMRLVSQKQGQRIEPEYAIGIAKGILVALHPFNERAKLKQMKTMSKRQIIAALERVPEKRAARG